MNTCYNAAQPAFTARFIPSGIELDAKKLQKVQEKFSKLTEHYKTDTLTVKPAKVERDEVGEEEFFNADFYTDKAAPASFLYLEDFKSWFNRASVDEAAKTLTRIFKAGKHIEASESKINEMRKHIIRLRNEVAVHRRIAEITKSSVFETLADHNERRANTLTKELLAKADHDNAVQNRIQDYPVDADMMWWKDLLYC